MVASKAYGFGYVHVCNHQPSRAVCVYYPLEQERLGLACCKNELNLKFISVAHSCHGVMQIRSVLARKRSRGGEGSPMNLACEQALARLMLFASMFRDLPLTTSVAEKHGVVASSSGKSVQLCTFGRPIPRCILLEHVTCHEIHVGRNHGNVRDASCFRKRT